MSDGESACCCFCVHTASFGVVERCGKFDRLADPGCHCLVPCFDTLRGSVPLGLNNTVVDVSTKTRDNAVVRVEVCIHYRVVEDKVSLAFYRLTDASEQISSFAGSIVRGEVPKYTLDEVFLMSDEIKKVIDIELSDRLGEYGYVLERTLLTKIDPSVEVKEAISQTQLNAYLRMAAEHNAELQRILTLKEAEATYEEMRLSGVGLAQERKAIMKGLQSSIEQFVDTVPGIDAKGVMNLLLLNQYFDSMKEMGSNKNNRVVMLPGSSGPSSGLLTDVMAAQVAASEMS
ncbi:unnamed protein product [Phytomonas sp. EM1]|nr:unnamed protein product [Phytomonas sp. EM1]|eukprot:CCW64720.1 unnamed protein product [Phytomonas sp. isolate EM1]